MRGGVVRIRGKELFGDLVEGEVNGVGRACAEAHGPDPAVERGGSFLLDDRAEGLPDPDAL